MSVDTQTLAIALGQAAPEPNSITDRQWQMWVEDAVMLIDARRDSLAITGPIDEARLDYVVREAVVAHIKKPDDATQVTISVDDGASSRTYQSGKGRVAILAEWWAILGLMPASGAFSFDMVPAGSRHLPWCSYSLGALYCSCGVDIAGRPIYELD